MKPDVVGMYDSEIDDNDLFRTDDILVTGVSPYDIGITLFISFRDAGDEKREASISYNAKAGENFYKMAMDYLDTIKAPKETITGYSYMQLGSGMFKESYSFNFKYEDKWTFYTQKKITVIKEIVLYQE